MALTGRADGPALQAPPAVDARLEQHQRAVGDVTGVDVGALLGERAALAGFGRHGTTSCGGGTRLVQSATTWCAVAMVRPDDAAAVEAWLGAPANPEDPWPAVAGELRRRPGHDVAARGQLLGLAVAEVGGGPVGRAAAEWEELGPAGPPSSRRSVEGALVVDLSSLWAGPLCGHLLQRAGARIVKVESTRRPDGARSGPASFFDLLHADQECVALDFAHEDGRAALGELVAKADVVIEASRPRALEQLGVSVGDVATVGRLRCWVSITAYGRAEPWGRYVGFGDDTAAAGGLVAWDEPGPVFCSDAVADPLAGLTATGAVFEALRRGGSWLVDVPLHASAAATIGVPSRAPWPSGDEAAPPRARTPSGNARPIGADTAAVLGELIGWAP
jgi:hypothetical protein